MAKHKTDETKGQYATEVEDSVNNARAMIGMDEPAIVIERPRVIAERQPNGEFIERTTPVYVKYSTAFKDELKGITGSELKVWTYIILSINENGTAFPGIRTVAEAVGVSHQTVITAVEGLEKKKLLHVVRGEKRYNIYQPSDEYVGIFSKDPMSQKIRPVKKEERTSQVSSANESNGLDLNKTLNQTKQNMPVSWKLAHGEAITEEDVAKSNLETAAPLEFERIFGFGTLPWGSNKTWETFRKFVVRLYAANPGIFKDYVAWRMDGGKYKAFSNRKIRENPAAFMDTGYPEYEASKMYRPAPRLDGSALERLEAGG
jgi:DNA-binding transcriptional regulator YhcF (GntR family)